MAKDLFSAVLDSISFTDIEDFLGLNGPVAARPNEGTLLDYKVDDSGDWVEEVAAFANTSGGLLFLGVDSDKNQNNAPTAIPGVAFSGGDIKARLTSKIVSQVIPRPEFDMVAASLPTAPTKFVVAIRVREGVYPPYQYTKGDRVRFIVRVQDTSRHATLRDLEYLFNKRGAFSETTEERLQGFFSMSLFPQLLKDYGGPAETERSPKPYHVWSVRPRMPLRLRLDRSFDQSARELVTRFFPDTGLGQFWPPSMTGGSHILRWQCGISSQTGVPVRWVRNFEWTASGDIRFAERIDRRVWDGGESVSDLYISGLHFLDLIEEFYRSRNSFGSLSGLHTVHLQPDFTLLRTFPDENGTYRETDAIMFSPMRTMDGNEVSNAAAELENLAGGSHVEQVCDFMLQHLRQLREATIDYDKVAKLVADCPIKERLIYFP